MNAFGVSIAGAFLIMAGSGECRPNDSSFDLDYGQADEDPQIQTASFAQAALLLTNGSSCSVRMNAAHRLGAIGGSNALNLLVSTFWGIPQVNLSAHDAMINPVKMDILRVIGRLHTPEAKHALLAIAKRYWAAGPRGEGWLAKAMAFLTGGRRGRTLHPDYEFRRVVVMSAHELERWSGDDAVYGYARAVTGSRKKFHRRFPDYSDRAYLIKLYESGDMKRKGTVLPDKIAEQAAMRVWEIQDKGRKGVDTPDEVGFAMKMLTNGMPGPIKSNLYAKAVEDGRVAEAELKNLAGQASHLGRWTDELRKKRNVVTAEYMKNDILKKYLGMARHCGLPYCLPLE